MNRDGKSKKKDKKKDKKKTPAPAPAPAGLGVLEEIWAILKPGSGDTPTKDMVIKETKGLIADLKKANEVNRQYEKDIKALDKKVSDAETAKAAADERAKELEEKLAQATGRNPGVSAINPAFLTEADKTALDQAAAKVREARKSYGTVAAKQADIGVLIGLSPIIPD